MLERTDRVWVSDCIDPLERQQMHRWTDPADPAGADGLPHRLGPLAHHRARSTTWTSAPRTAVFGHLGIEWDLAKASPAELAELGDWIALLQGAPRPAAAAATWSGSTSPTTRCTARGVVAPDRARAIYSYASVARSDVVLARAGADCPDSTPTGATGSNPRCSQHAPSGLRPPPWWGVTEVWDHDGYEDLAAHKPPTYVAAGKTPGVVLPGSVLGSVGLAAAPINPDHAVIYLVEAVE